MMAGTNAFMSDGEPEPVEVPLPSKEVSPFNCNVCMLVDAGQAGKGLGLHIVHE